MAATQCNISFTVDYISSQPIIAATASYKIQGSVNAPDVYNITPVPASGSLISLPYISVPGEYELIVELTGTDGEVVTEKSKFKIGNCSGNTPPKVSIKWRDNSGTEDRVCTSTCNEHIISVVSSDADNDIVKREVLLSLDNGNTWTVYNPDLSTNTIFGTGTLSTAGKRLFKVVVTDSVGNATTSNMLSYTKQADLGKSYKKIISGINCASHGDGPTNYDVWCTGRDDFSLSDSNLLGISTGYIRLKVDGGTSEIGLTKSSGYALVIGESIPVNSILTISYGAAGQNPPEAYPNGYPANVNPAIYRFEFSANGTTDWTIFDLSIDDY